MMRSGYLVFNISSKKQKQYKGLKWETVYIFSPTTMTYSVEISFICSEQFLLHLNPDQT